MKNITEERVKDWLPVRDENTYKNKMGQVLCIGGSAQMGGAIIMSASAALYAGAGLVSVASAPDNVHALHARIPEAMFLNMYDTEALINNIKSADTIVLGPGMGTDDEGLEVYEIVIENVKENQWLIIDGDAITLFSENPEKKAAAQTVFTPHLGEWERLTGIEPPAADREKNKKNKEQLDGTVVLKSGQTEIYFEDDIWQNISGNPSMATGGTGDTLTGIIASFLGQFSDKKQAILSAVYVHSAVANELAETHYVTLPMNIINYLPIFIKNLTL